MSDNEMLEKLLQRWEKQPDVMLPCAGSHTCGEVAGWIRALRASAALCEDCPPAGYPTDKTRCAPCPRAAAASAEPVAWHSPACEAAVVIDDSAPNAEIVAALALAYHELKKHDADYHHRTSIEINNKIVAALAKAKGGSLT